MMLQLGCSVQLDKRQAIRLGAFIKQLQDFGREQQEQAGRLFVQLETAKKQVNDKQLEIEHCHAVCDELRQKLDALALQVADSFGDGYYDGFIDGAKHHEDTDCSTDPDRIGEDAMRCSEIAEGEKSKRLGIVSRQELERQLATIEADVLDREADLITAAPADAYFAGQGWTEAEAKITEKIGAMMKSRAALARAKVGTGG